jgi:hypothetical protein
VGHIIGIAIEVFGEAGVRSAGFFVGGEELVEGARGGIEAHYF